MKKYEFYIILALAIVLMLLASCKTKRAIVEKTDSVAIHNVSLVDSIRSDVRFSFDEMMVRTLSPALSLDYGEGDSVQSLRMVEVDGRKVPVVIRDVRVVNGRLEKTTKEVKKKQVCDSLSVSSEKHTSTITPPPKPNCWFIIGMMIGVVIIIIASRARR